MDLSITSIIEQFARHTREAIGTNHYKPYKEAYDYAEPTADEFRAILSKAYYDMQSILDLCDIADRARRLNN